MFKNIPQARLITYLIVAGFIPLPGYPEFYLRKESDPVAIQ